jgi:prepilin-type N-terminal cleavage/methylation domain-containing protein
LNSLGNSRGVALALSTCVKRQQVRRSTRGFSLVEVLVATSLLAAGLAALAQLLALAVATGISARSGTAATVFAEQKIEQLRSEPWLPTDGVEYLDEHGSVILPGIAGSTYVRRWSIEKLDDRARIRVTVGRAGGQAVARMFGILPRRGP